MMLSYYVKEWKTMGVVWSGSILKHFRSLIHSNLLHYLPHLLSSKRLKFFVQYTTIHNRNMEK